MAILKLLSAATLLLFVGNGQKIEPGTQLRAEGMIGKHNGRLAVINPVYELLLAAGQEDMTAE